jgi:hypothetical protein
VRRLPLAFGASLALASSSALAGGSLDALAKEVAGLGPIAGPGIVVAAPLASDEPGSADDLPVRLATLVAAGLGAEVIAQPNTASLAVARMAAGRGKTLVFVRASIVLGDLRLTAELYAGAANVWDRVRNPADALARRATATAKIDAQARALLTPLSLERAQVRRFRLDEEDVLAGACGDIDGDGRDGLLLVYREKISLGHLREGRFSAERTVAWSDLTPRAPVPLREPLFSAVTGAGTILVGSTDYGGIALSTDFSKRDHLAGIPVWGGRSPSCLLAQPSAGAFDGAPVDCAPSRDPKPTLAVPAPRFDAFAAADIVDGRGGVRRLVAVREPSGRVKFKWGDEVGGIQGPLGLELSVGDLDQDGAPEIVTTTGAGDAIDVFTLTSSGASPESRIHLPTSEPVRAFALCPPGDHGAPALAAVVGREVWIVRPELGTAARGPLR